MSFLGAFLALVLPALPPALPDLAAEWAVPTATADAAPMRYRGIEALFAAFEARASVR